MDEQFAHLLRHFRTRAGLTLSELAEAVGAARSSIRAWEQGQRVPRDRARLADLAQVLHLSSAEAEQLTAIARQHRLDSNSAPVLALTHPQNLSARGEPAPTAVPEFEHTLGANGYQPSYERTIGQATTMHAASVRTHSEEHSLPRRQPRLLPPNTRPLFGRAADLVALGLLLSQPDTRILTLRGPAGVGKTHLALALANRLQPRFTDGMVFIDLAPLYDPSHLLPTIAQALGMLESGGAPLLGRLHQYLYQQRLLVVLDNFEHLLPAAPLLAELAAGTLQTVYLVTSRCVLNISGEYEWNVEPLPLPDLTVLPPYEELIHAPALACFLARAQKISPELTLTPTNAPIIAAICARVDGLPLAIELAAARLRLLTPAELLQRLDQRLRLLTSGQRDQPIRHATLRAAIDWSYPKLAQKEKDSSGREGNLPKTAR